MPPSRVMPNVRRTSLSVNPSREPSPDAGKRVSREDEPLGDIDLDEGPDAPPISQQIKAALTKNSARVIDLFKSWDADGNGKITRKEFHQAMPALGLHVPKADIDELFNEWDEDRARRQTR